MATRLRVYPLAVGVGLSRRVSRADHIARCREICQVQDGEVSVDSVTTALRRLRGMMEGSLRDLARCSVRLHWERRQHDRADRRQDGERGLGEPPKLWHRMLQVS